MLKPRKYSERLGVISGEQLQSVADEFGIGRITAAEPAPGGLFGQIVYLTTTTGEYVMRGNPHGHVQLTKERCVAQLIHQRSSLPAPWPYRLSENTELFGWTYAVMPRLQGATGSQLWDTADDQQRIAPAAATGEALARLHEITAPFAGPYDPTLDDFAPVTDFAGWVLDRLDETRAECRAVNALTAQAEHYIDATIEQCAEALTEPFEPVLVHHDFRPGNLTFELTGSSFEASGVFDLFETYFGDGEEDLVRMLNTVETDGQRHAFAGAYTTHRPLRPGTPERLAIYALADFLIIWGYGKRNHVWFHDADFLDTVRPIITNAQAINSTRAKRLDNG